MKPVVTVTNTKADAVRGSLGNCVMKLLIETGLSPQQTADASLTQQISVRRESGSQNRNHHLKRASSEG